MKAFKALFLTIVLLSCTPLHFKLDHIDITAVIRKYVELQHHMYTTNSTNTKIVLAQEECDFIHFVKYSSLLQCESQCNDLYNTSLRERSCLNKRRFHQNVNVSRCIRKQRKLFGCHYFYNNWFIPRVHPFRYWCPNAPTKLTHYKRLCRYSECIAKRLGYNVKLLTGLIKRYHDTNSEKFASELRLCNETSTDEQRNALKCSTYDSLFDSASFQSCTEQTFVETSFNRTTYCRELYHGGWRTLKCLVGPFKSKSSKERLDVRLKSKIRGNLELLKCLNLASKDRWIEQ